MSENQEKPGGGLSPKNRNQSVFFLVLGLETDKVSLKSVRWHVARLPSALVDTLLKTSDWGDVG